MLTTTRRPAADTFAPGPAAGVRVVALTSGEQRHVYLFRESRAADCLARIESHAADPEHPLTSADAALLRVRVLED